MTKIVAAVVIARPIGSVFEYATTPAHWPQWHPASRAVHGARDHALLIGEEVTEDFVVAGKRGSCVWRVTRRDRPRLWTITTATPRGRAEITYRLEDRAGNTVFERELAYETSGLLLAIMEFLVLRRRMRAESRVALERLKERLESPAADAESLPGKNHGTFHCF
jgi:uncharacterized protein YndB with AHSA1/START domain